MGKQGVKCEVCEYHCSCREEMADCPYQKPVLKENEEVMDKQPISSRSVQRRIASQKGEPAPDFSQPVPKETKETITSIEEFRKHYTSEDAKRYPIQVFVSQEELDLLWKRRGYPAITKPHKAISASRD